MIRKLVLRSVIVRMALPSLSTIKSISQSPNLFQSASLGRSWMLTLFLILGYGLMSVGRPTAVFHPMPAVPDQLPTCILADHLVDGFMGNAGSLLRQIAGYLFGRPLLLNDILLDAPCQSGVHRAVSRGTVLALTGKTVCLVPDILTVIRHITV